MKQIENHSSYGGLLEDLLYTAAGCRLNTLYHVCYLEFFTEFNIVTIKNELETNV